MGKKSQTEEATQEEQSPTPAERKYRYVGPDYPRLNFPARRIAFRPGEITDPEIDRLLERAPDLERYFERTDKK